MIGKLVGLLGGGPAAKIALVVGGVMVGAIIWLSVDNWLTTGRLEKANTEQGRLEQAILADREAIKARDQQLDAWQARFREQQARARSEERMRLELIAERDRIRAESDRLRFSIVEMKNEDESVKDYLDQPIPGLLLECLRGTGEGDCRSGPAALGSGTGKGTPPG